MELSILVRFAVGVAIMVGSAMVAGLHTVMAALVAVTMGMQPTGPVQAQREPAGEVELQHACSAAVQATLNRAVALMHSVDGGVERAFRDVLAEDPTCAIATWGTAILTANPFAGIGPPVEAERAQAAVAARPGLTKRRGFSGTNQ